MRARPLFLTAWNLDSTKLGLERTNIVSQFLFLPTVQLLALALPVSTLVSLVMRVVILVVRLREDLHVSLPNHRAPHSPEVQRPLRKRQLSVKIACDFNCFSRARTCFQSSGISILLKIQRIYIKVCHSEDQNPYSI